jgi:diaminopimelate epimerase
MSISLSFIKMHGLGNDFIVIDGVLCSKPEFALQKKNLTPQFARRICDRRFGIGADQILWIKPPKTKIATAEMEVINADGTTAEMCGNGIRAVALYLDGELPKARRRSIYPIDTGAGLLSVEVKHSKKGSSVRVNMGIPKFKEGLTLRIADGIEISYTDVSMGNPHAVIWVDDLDSYPTAARGAEIETHQRFPKRTNVEFIHAKSGRILDVRVWERGAGLTLACGTGACASAVAAILGGKCQSPLEVRLPGGSLLIEWARGGTVFMSGPAEEVFRGSWSF